MKKFGQFLLIFTVLTACATYSVHAQTASASADDAEATTETDQNNDIQELIKKKASENQIKGITTDSQKKRGFIAKVKRVSEEALTVESRKGTEVLTIDANVVILQNGKPFKISDIEIDSELTIMGYQDGEDFLPRRILVHKAPLRSSEKTIWVGSIKKIEKLALTILTRGSSEEKQFSFAKKVSIEDNAGEALKMADLETDQNVLLVTTPEKSDSQAVKESAGVIELIHSLAVVEKSPEKEITKDITPTPKSTQKPTATPKK